MTTIAGIQGIDFAVLVADSQITEDNLITLATSTPKIVSTGNFLIAISGDTRPGDILSYNWKAPTYKGEDPVQFMGKKVIPSIINAFNDNGYEYNKVDKEGGFDYLVAFNGNIFRIACDLSFFSSNRDVYAIGSGASEGLHVRSLVTELKATRGTHFMIHTDSSAAKSICATYGAPKNLRHVQLRYLFIQQHVQAGVSYFHRRAEDCARQLLV